jgi:hypothetical protein
LEVGEARFDLDDQKGPRGCVPRQDINRSSLPKNVEREFDDRIPAAAPKRRDDDFHDRCMRPVDQPIGASTLVSKVDGEVRVERHGDTLQNGEFQPSDTARSAREYTDWLTPARRATTTCVSPLVVRMARRRRPNRLESMVASIATTTYRRLNAQPPRSIAK